MLLLGGWEETAPICQSAAAGSPWTPATQQPPAWRKHLQRATPSEEALGLSGTLPGGQEGHPALTHLGRDQSMPLHCSFSFNETGHKEMWSGRSPGYLLEVTSGDPRT